MKSFYAAAVLLITLAGCSGTSTPEEKIFDNRMAKKRFTLERTGTIEIPLDSVSLNDTAYPVYFTNDTSELFIVGNEVINSIDFYDLNKRKLVRRNLYAKDGPKGILFTLKLFVKSLDSIYVYCQEDRGLLLTNFKGDVLQRYHMPWQSPHVWMANRVQPLTVMGDDVFFGYMNPGESFQQTGVKTMMKFNLKDSVAQQTGAPYPDVFKQYLYFNFLPFYTFGHAGNVVVRHGALPSVYTYSLAADSVNVFPMRSRFHEKEIVPNRVAQYSLDTDHDFEQIQQSDYGGVYYDRFHQVYYSVFHKGIDIEDKDGSRRAESDKPTSIMIFNEQFEYCGETLLTDKTYTMNYIPTKQGLLIPTAHAENPENNDDILRFDVFSLQEEK